MPYKDKRKERASWRKYYRANKAAHRARLNLKRRENRLRVTALKDAPCCDCGSRYPSYVMDFDHRDPSAKLFDIAKGVSDGLGWSTIKAEIDKCDVVCANCHRIRTYG